MGGLVVLLGGCASQLDRIETGIQANRDEMARIAAENQRTQQEVASLAELVRMQNTSGDQSGAMGVARLTQIIARLDQLQQMQEDNAEFMRNLSARVDLLVNRSGIPTLGEYRPPTKGAAASVLPEEGRTILDAADLDRSRGNDSLARSGYEEFLQRFGDSAGAARALFRLGDMDLDAGKFGEALTRFDALLKRFPQDTNAAAALYKSRRCLLALERPAEAAARARALRDNYPGSDEAALMEKELKQSH